MTQVIHVSDPVDSRAHEMTQAGNTFRQEALAFWVERICRILSGVEEGKKVLFWAKDIS